MSKVETIERQVESLSERELSRFREWFTSFDAKTWDRDFEEHVAAGKLDTLADEALAAHRAGKTSIL